MTNEEIIEEILYEADKKEVRSEVIREARKLMDENPKIERVNAYEQALIKCTSH